MILTIKEIVKKNKHVESIIRKSLYPYFDLTSLYSDFTAYLRGNNLLPFTKYKHLKELKDSHKGERCFIVATGPSLTHNDLDIIKDEYSFGMNSCVLALNDTKWIPQFFGIQDEYVYNKIKSSILIESKRKLAGNVYISKNVADLCTDSSTFKIFPLHHLDHKKYPSGIGKIRFSNDCYKTIYDGRSIIFALLQIAIYMGFKEIYLLGADCNYNQEKTNFINHGAIDPNSSSVGERLIYIHSKFKDFSDSMGVKIFNATRGGMLEVYPRVQLEDLFNIDKNK